MHEHLCRGKRTDNGKWIEGYYVRLHCQKGKVSHRIYTGYAESDCGEYYPDWFEVDPETVGRYTGLLDKNGKWIIEGDVVRVVSYDFGVFDEIGDVVFQNGCYGIRYDPYWSNGVMVRRLFHRIGKVERSHDHGFSGVIQYTYEIIGNAHDNPELLKG